jgi:hypothetical protein
MSEEQTVRSEDNALSSERATIISTLRKYIGPMKQHAKNQKGLPTCAVGCLRYSRFAPHSVELLNSGLGTLGRGDALFFY